MSLRIFLEAALAEPKTATNLPELYANTTRAFSSRGAGGTIVRISAGDRVRVTDVGQFGDVGITNFFDEPKAYQARASLGELTNFSGKT